jgi:hypothetical protein
MIHNYPKDLCGKKLISVDSDLLMRIRFTYKLLNQSQSRAKENHVILMKESLSEAACLVIAQ